MNYIVYDLEMVFLRTKQYLSEIIEVGAVKLKESEEGLEIVDMFQSYVKPNRYRQITAETTAFTGITQQNIDRADRFTDVTKQFIEWIGEEEYSLWSWGPDDKHQFVKQCRESNMTLDWIRNHNDLQQQYSRLVGGDSYQQIGLKRALDMLGKGFTGQQHRALEDAFNTAVVFEEVFPKLVVEMNNASEEEMIRTKLVYSTGNYHNSPFGKLAELMKGVS